MCHLMSCILIFSNNFLLVYMFEPMCYFSARVFNHIASQLRQRRSKTSDAQRDQARRVYAITKLMFEKAVQWPQRAVWMETLKVQKKKKSAADFIQTSTNPASTVMDISRASLNMSMQRVVDVSSAEEEEEGGGAEFNVADYLKQESQDPQDDDQQPDGAAGGV